jgi:anti-anti-sigma factor
MELAVSHMPFASVIHMAGRWDAFSAPEFDKFCADLDASSALRHILLDLSAVDYISSFGLRSLLNLGKLLDSREGSLCLFGMRPAVRRVFTGSGFASLFREFPDAASAVAAFHQQA